MHVLARAIFRAATLRRPPNGKRIRTEVRSGFTLESGGRFDNTQAWIP